MYSFDQLKTPYAKDDRPLTPRLGSAELYTIHITTFIPSYIVPIQPNHFFVVHVSKYVRMTVSSCFMAAGTDASSMSELT